MKIDPIVTIIGVVGTIATAFVVHLLIKVRDKKNSFINISTQMSKPFIEAKSILDLNTRGLHERCLPEDVFIQLYSDQRRSIQSMLPYIPKRQRRRLQAAWDDYEGEENHESASSWFSYNNRYKEDERIEHERMKRVQYLDRILFFFDYHNMFSAFRFAKSLRS